MERTGDTTDATGTTTHTAVPRGARWYSVGLCASAVLVGIAAWLAGSPLPSLGPVLLLAVAAALCVNRFALFPTEHAATAEAAVLLAAVVGFRTDAAILGPLLVALLVGPLDVMHWEQHSFVRMAYNAGNRGLATLAAVAAFAGTSALLGTSTPAWVVTVLLSASAFTLVDDVVSVVLLRLHGEPYRTAVSHVFGIDLLMMPVALVGAATGILAGEVGWWATVLALLPAAFVPEVVIARGRVRVATVRDLAALLGVIAILTTVALVTPIAATATLAVLCVLAVLLGIEVAPGDGALVPPLVAMVVIPACAVLDDDRVRVGAVVVAVVATATSWWCARHGGRTRVLAASAIAFGAALIAAQLALELPRTVDGLIVGAFSAGAAFEVVALVGGAGRRRRAVRLAWMVPVIASAAAGAAVWRAGGLEGALVVTGLVAAALVGWTAWGAPAWRSRIARRLAPYAPASFVSWLVLAALAVVAAVMGVVASEPRVAVTWAWTGAGLGEVAIATVASGVRQWRFAPWPRRVGFATTLAASGALLLVAAPLGVRGSPWGPAVVAVSLAAVAWVARAPARRVHDERVATRDEVDAR